VGKRLFVVVPPQARRAGVGVVRGEAFAFSSFVSSGREGARERESGREQGCSRPPLAAVSLARLALALARPRETRPRRFPSPFLLPLSPFRLSSPERRIQVSPLDPTGLGRPRLPSWPATQKQRERQRATPLHRVLRPAIAGVWRPPAPSDGASLTARRRAMRLFARASPWKTGGEAVVEAERERETREERTVVLLLQRRRPPLAPRRRPDATLWAQTLHLDARRRPDRASHTTLACGRGRLSRGRPPPLSLSLLFLPPSLSPPLFSLSLSLLFPIAEVPLTRPLPSTLALRHPPSNAHNRRETHPPQKEQEEGQHGPEDDRVPL
jgi:hypothetical protein